MCFCSNYAVDFVGNKLVNVQKGPITITSAAQITISNTTFVNVLCEKGDTMAFAWETPGSLVFLANVANVTFSGNEIVNNEGCQYPNGNYAHPVSMVNATGIEGLQTPSLASLLQKDGTTTP